MMQVSEQVKDVIDHLADKLKVPTEVVWGALLKQAAIVGWPMVVGFSLVQVIIIFSYVYAIKKFREMGEKYDDREGMWFGSFIATCLFILFTVATLFSIMEGVTALLNPEYWAIEKILDMVK